MKTIEEFIQISYTDEVLGVLEIRGQQLLIIGSKTIYNEEQVWDIHFPNTKYWSIYIPVSAAKSDIEIFHYLKEQITNRNLQVGELVGFEY